MMPPAFDRLTDLLKRFPGLGYRSAERLAMHLLVEHRDQLDTLVDRLKTAAEEVSVCPICGNISEGDAPCGICTDPARDESVLCIVEQIPDLIAIERSGAWRGRYHVLGGKLSPIHGVGPNELNFTQLLRRLAEGNISELVLALSNDIEGQATCHYIQEEIIQGRPIRLSRIGFGLPSGGGVTFADSVTLRSALDGRRSYS